MQSRQLKLFLAVFVFSTILALLSTLCTARAQYVDPGYYGPQNYGPSQGGSYYPPNGYPGSSPQPYNPSPPPRESYQDGLPGSFQEFQKWKDLSLQDLKKQHRQEQNPERGMGLWLEPLPSPVPYPQPHYPPIIPPQGQGYPQPPIYQPPMMPPVTSPRVIAPPIISPWGNTSPLDQAYYGKRPFYQPAPGENGEPIYFDPGYGSSRGSSSPGVGVYIPGTIAGARGITIYPQPNHHPGNYFASHRHSMNWNGLLQGQPSSEQWSNLTQWLFSPIPAADKQAFQGLLLMLTTLVALSGLLIQTPHRPEELLCPVS